jgi:O-acetyl-ADP-ribose deacetylase (regulator of RNase III)
MGPVPTGNCGISFGDGKLKSKKIIHAVPPIYKNFSHEVNEVLLTALVINTLEVARNMELKSISIPALSKEIGWPMEDCAYIILSTVAKWCGQEDLGKLKQIRLCNKDEKTTFVFNSFFSVIFKDDKGEKTNMNDRKFTVRKSRKSTKKGPNV